MIVVVSLFGLLLAIGIYVVNKKAISDEYVIKKMNKSNWSLLKTYKVVLQTKKGKVD